MSLTPLELVGVTAIATGVVVWAWCKVKIDELREDLGSLPHLYAEALEDIDDLTAERGSLQAELRDAVDREMALLDELGRRDPAVGLTLAGIDEREQERNAERARLAREADMRARADRLGVKHWSVDELSSLDRMNANREAANRR